ncbi:MAG: helix-turn-helix transcriptional regulator, partial [Alphaproteobacteria bacterium]|nr:helix-turn-helix transcriptional regulator [Alphaproteobacteria bacterium]
MTEPEGYHYAVIARALRLIDAEGGTAMPLDDLARALNMSPAHFQRVFTRWVGVSPKRYQQYLTLDLAKRLLAERHTVLDAADGAGLSGGGRLHDLFVRWEAMSPGEFARAGEGLKIHWGWSDSPFGPALLMATDRGICGIGFAAETGAEATMADLLGRWPKADFVEDPM